MRKKELGTLEEDTYRVALNLLEAVVEQVMRSMSDGEFSAPLAETILSSQTLSSHDSNRRDDSSF